MVSRLVTRLILMIIIFCLCQSVYGQIDYLYDHTDAGSTYLFDDSNYYPFTPQDIASPCISSDPCEACDEVSMSNSEKRPGSPDSYSYKWDAPYADIAACCTHTSATNFSIGAGTPFYYTFWIKFGSNCRITTGRGKLPELNRSTGESGDARTRISFAPGGDADSWSIPQPTYYEDTTNACGSNHIYDLGEGWGCWTDKVIPTIIVWPNYGGSSNPNTAGGLYWSQNVNTGSPVYLELGLWYQLKMYVYPSTTAGSGLIKVWVNNTLIIDLDADDNIKTLRTVGDTFEYAFPHIVWNDHGTGTEQGSYTGCEIYLDDISVTSYDPGYLGVTTTTSSITSTTTTSILPITSTTSSMGTTTVFPITGITIQGVTLQ